jgi:excisionase family DNA binding protein
VTATQSQPAATQALLEVAQVAELLNCSQRQVYRLSDAGKMPRPVRLGRLIRWDRDSLMRWIAEGCPPVRRLGKGVV